MRRVFALVVILGCAGGGAATTLSDLPADCPTVVRAYYADPAMVRDLARWTEPWEVDRDGGFVVVGVDADGFDRLVAAGFEIVIDEKLTRRMCRPAELLPGQTEGIPGYPCYRTVEETFQAAQDLVAQRPDLASWHDAGDSWEKATGMLGYDMMVLKLTNSAVAGTPTGIDPPHGKPRLYVTSAIHAREYTTAELMTRFAEYLVAHHGVDPDVTWLLDEHEIHLMLHANPDGRKHAESGDLWRKNTNQAYCGATSSDRGADLNRNFDFQWACCGGSSSSECSDTYHGASAASEPETQAIQAYGAAIFPDQRDDAPSQPAPDDATGVYIDVHSYSQLVLWPWGSTYTAPPNDDGLRPLGRRLAWFNGYEPDQSVGLYPTDGTTTDFFYGRLGVAAYTFELGTWFFQECAAFENQILPDNLEALLYAAKHARAPYLTASGPDARDLAVSPGTVVAPGETVTVTAVLDDTRYQTSNGSEPTHPIASAEATLDTPPWTDPPPAPIALLPVDGAFSSTVETVEGTVDTTGLADGRHTLFVHGSDTDGHRGAVTAAFFWVLDPATAPHLVGTVTDADDGTPLAATVTAGAGFSIATDPADGSYDLMLPPGTYDVTFAAADHAPATLTGITLDSGATEIRDVALAPITTLLFDDAEGGNIGWTADSPWAITTETSASPTHSWSDSPGGDYDDYEDASLTSPVLDLTWISGVSLEFSHVYEIEEGYDYGSVEVSTDGGSTWSTVVSYDGSQSSWTTEQIGLPQLDGVSNARIRFRFDSDVYISYDGWHIDDIAVRGGASLPSGLLFADGFESGDSSAWTEAVP